MILETLILIVLLVIATLLGLQLLHTSEDVKLLDKHLADIHDLLVEIEEK